MSTWKEIIDKSFSPAEFVTYCNALQWNTWRPSFIVLHNTGEPTLKSNPNGITQNDINGLVNYYKNEQKWSAGPHLFVDDRQIWVFTPLTTQGVHSPSWNNVSLGVEMLGDYDAEEFDSGRGLAVQHNAVSALATLCSVLGFDPDTIRLHKEDPKTTHKHCPGKHVNKVIVLDEVKAALATMHAGEHAAQA